MSVEQPSARVVSLPQPSAAPDPLALIIDSMREMSRQTDPQEMVRAYGERMQQLTRLDRRLSLSRRGLKQPEYRITRSTTWTQPINPWKEKDRLPLLRGGILADLIYGDQPRLFTNLSVDPDDPAAEYLAGHFSLAAIPLFDQGEALNMVILLNERPDAFASDQMLDFVWRSNLFGRATSNLVLHAELQEAYRALDRERKIVGEIQRSLLPAELPRIPTLDVAAYYQPAQRAGGDYYDFFPLPDGRFGIFIADVSGHGTPAAVLMAVTHCIAHTLPGPPAPPGHLLNYLNRHLIHRYARPSETFVTAFYGIYDPARRELTYACAGHNPPRLKRCQDGSLLSLDAAGGLPLGVVDDPGYQQASLSLKRGDQVIFYTDGITEAANEEGALLGISRLDQALEQCTLEAQGLLDTVLAAVERFTLGRAADDDRTLIVARVS